MCVCVCVCVSRYLVEGVEDGLLEALGQVSERPHGALDPLPHLLVLQSLVVGHVVRQLAGRGGRGGEGGGGRGGEGGRRGEGVQFRFETQKESIHDCMWEKGSAI